MKINRKKQLIELWNKSKKYYEKTELVELGGTLKTIAQLTSNTDYVLDIGSGLTQLSKFVDTCYIGIDISKLALKSAHTNLKTHLINADAEKLPFKNKIFNKIMIINALEHMFAPDVVLTESYRVCKSGGVIILHGPAYDFPIACPPSIITQMEKKSKISIMKLKFYLQRIKNYILNLIGIDNMSANIIEHPNPQIKSDEFVSDSDTVYLVRIKEILNFLRRFPGKIKYIRHGNKWYNKFSFSKYWFSKLFIIFKRK